MRKRNIAGQDLVESVALFVIFVTFALLAINAIRDSKPWSPPDPLSGKTYQCEMQSGPETDPRTVTIKFLNQTK